MTPHPPPLPFPPKHTHTHTSDGHRKRGQCGRAVANVLLGRGSTGVHIVGPGGKDYVYVHAFYMMVNGEKHDLTLDLRSVAPPIDLFAEGAAPIVQ